VAAATEWTTYCASHKNSLRFIGMDRLFSQSNRVFLSAADASRSSSCEKRNITVSQRRPQRGRRAKGAGKKDESS